MGDKNDRMAAGKLNWNLLLPTAVAIAGILFGYTQFLATAKLEAKKPFLEKQLDLCFEACRLAATAATTESPALFEKSGARFKELYFGGMVIIEDRGVERAMIDVFQGLNVGSNPELPVKSLELDSLCLAHKCRKLMAKSWGIDFGELSQVPADCTD